MANEIKMPKFGETMTEGTINRWYKNENEEVEAGETIFEISTDKANLEVEAPASGILAKILIKEGEKAAIGEVVAVLMDPGEKLNDFGEKSAEIKASGSKEDKPDNIEALQYDTCILGGGPAGYVAAIKAAQLNQKVALIEEEDLGGTCLNRGCIPTKTYLRHSEFINDLKKADEFGIELEGYKINWAKMKNRKDRVVNRLVGGIDSLLKKNRVDVYKDYGELTADKKIKLLADKKVLSAESIIIATGSKPIIPPIDGIDHPDVITSREALDLNELPDTLVIIGGGVIGVELATIYASLNIEVIIVEIMDQILPRLDQELVKILHQNLLDQGVKIMTESEVGKIDSIDSAEKSLKVEVKTDSKNEIIAAEKVLVAAGREANLRGLENIDLKLKKGCLKVDSYLQTNISSVYAAGDVIGEPWLAHVASAEGIVAAKNTANLERRMDYSAVPACIYTIPELATVGLNEEQARQKGYQVKVGKFPFSANGKALASGYQEGMVKIVSDDKWNQVLGVQIIGPHATELIAEAVLAVRMEVTSEILAETIHAHPSLSEAIMESAYDACGRALHL